MGFFLALAGILAACAGIKGPPAIQATLMVAVPNGDLFQPLQAIAAQYQQDSGQIVQVVALDSDRYDREIALQLLSGLAHADVIWLSAADLPRWEEYHVLRPLGAQPKDASFGQRLVSAEGQIYAFAGLADPLVLWVRADLLQAAGLAVPANWDAVRQAARALNAPPQRFGLAIAGSDQAAGEDFAALLPGFGGSLAELNLGGAPARQALAFYVGLRRIDAVTSPQSVDFSRADVLSALQEGRAGMGFAPLSAAAQLQNCPANTAVCVGEKPLLAWAWLPGLSATKGIGNLSVWSIPLHAAHGQAAAQFLAWMGSSSGQQVWDAHRPAGASSADLARMTDFQLVLPAFPRANQPWNPLHEGVHAALMGALEPEQSYRQIIQAMQPVFRQAQGP